MKISLEFYETLRQRITLTDVIKKKVFLVKKSSNYLGLCPFHQEKTPSFTVNNLKRFFYCFGCGEHGDVIRFISLIKGISYKESAMELANDYSIMLPIQNSRQEILNNETNQLLSVLQMVQLSFKKYLTQEVVDYLIQRGLTHEMIDKFGIGFVPKGFIKEELLKKKSIPSSVLEKVGLLGRNLDGKVYEIFYNRITFPITNMYNKVIAFSGRAMNDVVPRYINSPETIFFRKKDVLYGEINALQSIRKSNFAILVEGQMDVIALHQSGVTEAVGSLGTSITEEQLKKIWKNADEIIICLDGDEAGKKAIYRVINLVLPLINTKKRVSFINLPLSTDPDHIVRYCGVNIFKDFLHQRQNLSEMIWKIESSDKVFCTPEDISFFEDKLLSFSNKIGEKSLRYNYHRYFKKQIWQSFFCKNIKVNNSNLLDSGNFIPISLPSNSEVDILEQVFCLILLKCPEFLKKEEIRNFLLTLHFSNDILNDFRDWYFETINDTRFSKEKISDLLEKSRFREAFLVFSDSNKMFFELSLNSDDIDLSLIWEWLYKSYHLVLLKKEYTKVVFTDSSDTLGKALLYKEEIIKISQELNILKESFSD